MFEKAIGFLSRLRKDTRGNVVAIAAAMIIPMIGLVGGAVDMSRLYATKTRLQAACDAGALAGRRTMGTGTWAANSNRANGQAQSVFQLNVRPGAFGSTNAAAVYTENSGTVTGTATAQVPMTLMSIFGTPTGNLSVSCTSMMVIPNTDVMFVLDTTGSMNCVASQTLTTSPACSNNGGVEANGGSDATNAKIIGLRKAVKCFYEALTKTNTSAVCETQPGDTPPSGGISAGVQLRFGFVPYSSNVNVGRLLPTSYFANTRVFSSRRPTDPVVSVWGWSAGSYPANNGAYGAYGATPNSNLRNASSYSGWTFGSTTGSVTATDGTFANKLSGTSYDTQAECTAANGFGASGDKTASYISVDGANGAQTINSETTPTYPGTTQTATYNQSMTRMLTGYRYAWGKPIGINTNGCYLQSGSQSYTTTRTGATATRNVTWTQYERIVPNGWTYANDVSLDISGLKNGSNWNTSVDLPISEQTISFTPSGSKTSTNYKQQTNTTVTWEGCIEERRTFMNTDTNPDDDWSPVPTTANDLDINSAPVAGDANTLWGPALEAAVFGRYTGSNNSGSTKTNSSVTAATASKSALGGLSCPSAAKRLTKWNDSAAWSGTNLSFEGYVDALRAEGSTYHDLGLLWGARLMAPDGIFTADNKKTLSGASITRHMIFMTDGDTGTCSTAYSPYGTAWWDRRQTNKSDPSDNTGSLSCNNDYLNRIVDARTAALCTKIKNMDITLWVVSYGAGVNQTTIDRLTACASPGRYYTATDTATLISNFQEIANKISSLRLTQ